MPRAVRVKAIRIVRAAARALCERIPARLAARSCPMNRPPQTLDAVAAAIVLVDAQGLVTAANAAFTPLTGRSVADIVGRAVGDLCASGRHAAALDAACRQAQASGSGVGGPLEIDLRQAGDAALPVSAHCRPWPPGLCLTLLDRQAEQSWRIRAEHVGEMLGLAQEFGRVGLFERDVRTLDGHWDQHLHRLFGIGANQPTPSFDEASRFIVPQDRERVRRAFIESLARAGTYDLHYRIAGANGTTRQLHSQWRVKNGDDGRPERVQGVITDDTDVWHLAHSVSDTQSQLTLAVELGRIAIWRHDLRSNRLYYNDQGWRILGLDPQPDGLTLDEVRSMIHPDDQPQVRAALERALKSDEPVDMEARYRHADGRWLDILTRRVTQRDETGTPVGFVGVAMDLTERLSEQRRLQELTRRLDMATTAAGVGVWSFDVTSGVAHWNAQMYAVHGLPPDAPAPGWPAYLDTFVAPGQRDELNRGMERLVAEAADDVTRAEMHIVRTDGAVRELSVRARALREGASIRMIGTMVDVTDHRTEQLALREAHTRMSLAARSVGVGIWETDSRTGEGVWDEQMWRLRGLEPRGKQAPPYAERLALVHPDDLESLRRTFGAISPTNRPSSVEFRVRWPDGSWRWLASRSTPIFDEQGQEIRRLGVNWDVTEARGAEQARQARQVALRESQAKSQFLARMSHELRTPLHAVIGFAQLLLADPALPTAGDTRERVGHIRAAGQHLLALVDDVLDLSSLDAGELRLDSRCLALDAEVDAVLPMVAAQAASLDVRIERAALAHAVQADPTRLRQIVLNLLTNAVKYNRRGGQVRIEAHADGAMVVLEVHDTGRGLTPQQLAHVFEPFNRLGAEREGIEGTGIGLAIVKINVERMGGAVSVRSEAGVGSCFEVRLPVGVVLAPEPTAAAMADAAAVAPTPRAHGARVLYIEDNPVNALIVRELLTQRRDLVLDEAPDGCSGIDSARRMRPNLILLDMQLPDIDGMEVLRRLRADPATAAIPCIALSANAMPDDIQTALSAGFADYWTKPLDFRVFMSALDSLFGKTPA